MGASRGCARGLMPNPTPAEHVKNISPTHGQEISDCSIIIDDPRRATGESELRGADRWRRNWRPAWRARSRKSSKPGRIRRRRSLVSRVCRSFTARTPRRRGEVRDHARVEPSSRFCVASPFESFFRPPPDCVHPRSHSLPLRPDSTPQDCAVASNDVASTSTASSWKPRVRRRRLSRWWMPSSRAC